MKMNEILGNIKMLASGQGFYGRLYNAIMDLKNTDKERYAELKRTLEQQNFKDVIDMIFYFEC